MQMKSVLGYRETYREEINHSHISVGEILSMYIQGIMDDEALEDMKDYDLNWAYIV